MSWTRAALPAAVAAVAAVIFGLLRPGLTDTYFNGLEGRLHWAALGGALGGLATVFIRTNIADGTTYKATKELLSGVLTAFAVGAFAVAVWFISSDGWKWLPALVVVGCAIFLLAVLPRVAWKTLFSAMPTARPHVIRLFILLAVAAIALLCLLYPEKVDRLASTVFSVVLAVGLIASVWILLNMLVENARKNWAAFSGFSAAIVAAIAFAIMRGNISLKSLVVAEDLAEFGAGSGFWGHVEWPIFGALVWGLGVFLMRRFGSRIARIAIGIALGVLTGWQIGDNSLLWQRPNINWGSAIVFTLVFAALGSLWRLRRDGSAQRTVELPLIGSVHQLVSNVAQSVTSPGAIDRALPGALTGAAIGFTFSAWLRTDFIGSGRDVFLAAAIPLALLGVRIAWNPNPDATKIAAFENRSHAAIFLGPALLFLSSALVIPAIRTIFLSTLDRNFNKNSFEGNTFDGFNAEGDAFVGFDNYRELLQDVDTFDFSKWTNLFTSQLFWVALILLVAGLVAGMVSGTKRNGVSSYAGTGSSVGSLAFGALLLAFAVLSVLRGTFFNNLWWVVTVTSLSVTLGLTIAVLSERAGRLESIAKSLIFMPMAISFVGASVVWRLQYQPRDVSKTQTGVLNALWVKLGSLSHSGAPRIVVLVLLAALLAFIVMKGYQRAVDGQTFGAFAGLVIVVGYLFIELLRRSLGGFQFGPNGEILPDTIIFLQQARPFNNVFLMVILIWIQTGFAMVILSAAIKAVPTELIEAAEVDGATESQRFFQVVLPQILPTIGVVTTTLIVLVSKVFDIVKVGTGGNFGTNVLANDMFEVSFSFGNFPLGSAIAVFILISVLPVMYLNVRRMQKARA